MPDTEQNRPMQHTEEEATNIRCCGRPLTGNAKTLITTTVMTTTITVTQFVASLPRFANSLALRADCLSMLVDILSYLGNLFAECNPDISSKKDLELGASGISLALLLSFTAYFLYEGVVEVSSKSGDSDEDDVDPRVVLAFSLFGLVVNGISIWSFICWADSDAYDIGGANDFDDASFNDTPRTESINSNLGTDSKTSMEQKEESVQSESVDSNTASSSMDNEDVEHNRAEATNYRKTGNLNMISALMHVGSDLLRSTTTFIEAIIILRHPEIDSTKVGAYLN
jgi:Co/Zn/Cd efflux system component